MNAMSESARATSQVARELSESVAARAMATSPFTHPDRHFGTGVGQMVHFVDEDEASLAEEQGQEVVAEGESERDGCKGEGVLDERGMDDAAADSSSAHGVVPVDAGVQDRS